MQQCFDAGEVAQDLAIYDTTAWCGTRRPSSLSKLTLRESRCPWQEIRVISDREPARAGTKYNAASGAAVITAVSTAV
jgi:hypothetical protein